MDLLSKYGDSDGSSDSDQDQVMQTLAAHSKNTHGNAVNNSRNAMVTPVDHQSLAVESAPLVVDSLVRM